MTVERIRSFVPLETTLLPRPLDRFGRAFPASLAECVVAAYAPERGVVLDPLAHPLSAADASARAGRHGVARSPQPLGAWARRAVDQAPPAEETLAALARVAESALAGPTHAISMRELYGARCGTCRAPVTVEAFLWERDAFAPAKKAFRCGVCAREGRALLIEPVDADDEASAQAQDARGLAYWQFVERFAEVERGLGESVAVLYTPRNLGALMATLRAIETTVGVGPARDLLLLAFLEVVVTGSRLNAVAGRGTPLRIERGRARRGHAAQSREINVWLEYERCVRDLVQWIAAQPAPKRAREFAAPEDLPGKADLVLCEAPVDDALGGWSHVASVLCLGAVAAGTADATDGRATERERVLRSLRQALIDGHRRSSEDAPAVVYLPHADLASIAACALAGTAAGYRLRGILYQRDALATPSRADASGAAAVLDFGREGVTLLRDQTPANAASIEDAIRHGVREAIAARGEPVGAELAGVGALLTLAERGLLASLTLARAGGVSELEVFLDHFRSALGDAKRSGLERVGEAPHALMTISSGLDATPLDDRVEWGIWGLLSAAREIETKALLRRAYALFRDLETPDRELVERCIAAYGAQGADGRWRLRDEDALVKRQAEQTALAADLVDAAHRLGFKVSIGRDLRRRALAGAHAAMRGSILGDLLSDAEREASLARHMRGPADVLDHLDVVWYDRAHMVFVWQLEWTARIHRSVVQLGEAIPDDDRVFRFLAVADERRGLVGYKLVRSAALAEAVRRRAWRFVKWEPLRRFAAGPETTLADLEGVLGLEPAVEQAGQQLAFKW